MTQIYSVKFRLVTITQTYFVQFKLLTITHIYPVEFKLVTITQIYPVNIYPIHWYGYTDFHELKCPCVRFFPFIVLHRK